MKKVKKFSRKEYTHYKTTKYKSDAKKWAKRKRREGVGVRVIPCGGGSAIYVRGKYLMKADRRRR